MYRVVGARGPIICKAQPKALYCKNPFSQMSVVNLFSPRECARCELNRVFSKEDVIPTFIISVAPTPIFSPVVGVAEVVSIAVVARVAQCTSSFINIDTVRAESDQLSACDSAHSQVVVGLISHVESRPH